MRIGPEEERGWYETIGGARLLGGNKRGSWAGSVGAFGPSNHPGNPAGKSPSLFSLCGGSENSVCPLFMGPRDEDDDDDDVDGRSSPPVGTWELTGA